VRLVGDEEGTVPAGEFAGGEPVAIFGKDDAYVGHGGLDEEAGDVVALEGCLEREEIVEFDDASGFRGIDGRTYVAGTRADGAAGVKECGEALVDGAVVAIVEDEDFRALGDFAGYSNGEAFGVGGA
jgi:hypothetical protein